MKGISLVILLGCIGLFVSGCCSDDEMVPLEYHPPVAAVTATPDIGIEPLDTVLDASGSTDSDGTIVQYDWDFDSDGTYDLLDGGVSVNHTYDPNGTYTATVRVTDDDGLTDTASVTVTVTELEPPVAAGEATPEGVGSTVASLDASESFDTDGTVVQYDWDFDNDGTFDLIDGGPTPDHDFGAFGTFIVAVRVTDDDGLTDTAEISVTLVDAENEPPVADVVPDPANGDAPLDVTWDASGSTDSDGTIVQYDWDMDNDGTFEVIDGGVTQAANYAGGGSYTVGVQVTDDDGATDTATATCEVNEPPMADLVGDYEAVSEATGKAVSATLPESWNITWDASGSTDSDGTIERYDWDLDNDGTYETADGGDTQVQNVGDFGSYTVGVMVTDDDGATDTATATVTVLVPPTALITVSPESGDAPIDVTWDASTSYDPDGTIEQYDWDMDNDGTYEIIDGTVTQVAPYTVGGNYTVRLRVTDNDGFMDETDRTVTINNPPVAALTNTFEENQQMEMFVIHWDASGSTDSDGTIVQYDWDMDNDGTFETTNGGPTQDMDYFDWEFLTVPVVGVRVTDDDGAQDETYASTLFPPLGIVLPTPSFGSAPLDVTWDASTSWDPDGGSIVQYDFDLDGDDTYEYIDQGPTLLVPYSVSGFYMIQVRVTDDEGEIGYGYGSIFVTGSPE